jgi:hypothetical protein
MNRVIHLHTRRVVTSAPGEGGADEPRRETWRDAREPERSFVQTVLRRARRLSSRVEKTIVARPWQAALAIGATGVWLGSMIGRGSSKKLVRRVLIGAAAYAARRMAAGLLEDLRLQMPLGEPGAEDAAT